MDLYDKEDEEQDDEQEQDQPDRVDAESLGRHGHGKRHDCADDDQNDRKGHQAHARCSVHLALSFLGAEIACSPSTAR